MGKDTNLYFKLFEKIKQKRRFFFCPRSCRKEISALSEEDQIHLSSDSELRLISKLTEDPPLKGFQK